VWLLDHGQQQLPVNLAWEAFREANGVSSLEEMRARIAFYRRTLILATENPTVGCILLAEPFFWPEGVWISYCCSSVESLPALSKTELLRRWRERLKQAPPSHLNKSILVSLLAYKLQEQV
jgi:hypothetical protein